LRWSTFLRLHAPGVIACDFLVAVTATVRLLYVFLVIEHHSRRLTRRWVPVFPDPPLTNLHHTNPNSRHRRGESHAVSANPILGGLQVVELSSRSRTISRQIALRKIDKPVDRGGIRHSVSI
jgi:hypothetical protein